MLSLRRIVGPKALIHAVTQAGSFLDGGSNRILQVAALPMLEPERVQQDKIALQKWFKYKRDVVIAKLEELGFEFPNMPNSTFYIWSVSLRGLVSIIEHAIGWIALIFQLRSIMDWCYSRSSSKKKSLQSQVFSLISIQPIDVICSTPRHITI